MKVTVTTFGAAREWLPDPTAGRAVVEAAEGATVGDLITGLAGADAALHLVLVDGQRADLGTKLLQGAEVTLMPPFSGGSI